VRYVNGCLRIDADFSSEGRVDFSHYLFKKKKIKIQIFYSQLFFLATAVARFRDQDPDRGHERETIDDHGHEATRTVRDDEGDERKLR
jgi:hypothetical protein